MTVAYPDGNKPLQLMDLITGLQNPCDIVIHYRKYPIHDVPTDLPSLTSWIYSRYQEKDAMLESYYSNGAFPSTELHDHSNCIPPGRKVVQDVDKIVLIQIFYLASIYIQYKLISF